MLILRGENKKTPVIAIFSFYSDGPKGQWRNPVEINEGTHRGITRLRSVRFAPCAAIGMT